MKLNVIFILLFSNDIQQKYSVDVSIFEIKYFILINVINVKVGVSLSVTPLLVNGRTNLDEDFILNRVEGQKHMFYLTSPRCQRRTASFK